MLMRALVLSVPATALALTIGCNKEDTPPGVAQKPVEAANVAAEDLREAELPSAERAKEAIEEANEEAREAHGAASDEVREAQREVVASLAALRSEIRSVQLTASSFEHNRNKVVANVAHVIDRLEAQAARVGARSGVLTGEALAEVDGLVQGAKTAAAEARAKASALSRSSATTWEQDRDAAMAALDTLSDKVAEASAKVYVDGTPATTPVPLPMRNPSPATPTP